MLHVSVPTSEGTAEVLLGYVREQLARGWRVSVACPSEGWLGYVAREAGAEVAWWRAGREPGVATLEETARLSALVTRLGPDLVHLHSSKAGLAGRLAVRRRVPTVFQPHAWSFQAGSGTSSRLARRWERFAVRWTDQVVCVGEGERLVGEAAGVRAEVTVVPNGVDLRRFGPTSPEDRVEARARLGLREAPTVVCVGRLSHQKGQDGLLDAWTSVLGAVPGAQLVLVGAGPDEADLRRRASGLGGVVFVGARVDVPDWLSAADVVTVPSRYEGMALAPLEAMASGRSVVATDVPGIAEGVVDGVGALVPPGDPDALAAALVERLLDPARADDEGWAGYDHVSAERDAAEAARRVARLSLSLMASRNRA
ncbi:glycosyltransferase [Nocardioides kribbensis]|uniref:Glycosyltransferase n=1 Tax=Nocardioides kribbensis TaxID=305517 RepID=A0ABV1NWG5_9ACTN